ncbi:protein ARABIDILLO 1 [Citrus sinensis]|nr:protein ARABIDILLO 1 [Citrus sinensis]
MTRRVQQKVSPSMDQNRASLSSTCRAYRLLGSSPCLWSSLDLRPYKFDTSAAESLSSRCTNLQALWFRGALSADAMIILQARRLREINVEFCRELTDAIFSAIVARHEMLEILHFGLDVCDRISSDAIKTVAYCCPKLRRLWLSGVREVNGDAINALAKQCRQLVEVGFIDSGGVDEAALENLSSVRYLSIAGTRNLNWSSAAIAWSKLTSLVGLDTSRTNINLSSVTRLLSSSRNLKVLIALNCPVFEAEADTSMMYNQKGKVVLSLISEIFKGVASLFSDTTEINNGAFQNWRKLKVRDRISDEIVSWIERVLSHSLMRISKKNPKEFDDFWLRQGATLLLSLMESSQQEVQERAAYAVATFVVIDDQNAMVDCQRAEAILRHGGVRLLLDLARSPPEGLQSEVAKAIANLSVDSKVAKAVSENGGIDILADLARSTNRLVAEEVVGGLWNLSVGEDHKGAIARAGGIKALVDLIFKWSSWNDGVLERAAGALANLAADDKCSLEVARAGGVHALVMLARSFMFEGVQEQAARALANLVAHGDSNSNNAAVGLETGALEALVQLTFSKHEGVRQEAAGALWNLSFDDRNREAIAAAGGVEALVALVRSCPISSQGLQERAAGALWGLSVSEANSIAIGREGGVAPLIALARSAVVDVHETAAGALWNLAFNPGNALCIVEGGVGAHTYVNTILECQCYRDRMEDIASIGSSLEDVLRRIALKHIEDFVRSFSDPQAFATALASAVPKSLAQITEGARIPEAAHLRCSGAEIGRFVSMLRNPSSILKACAAVALLQFTMPGGQHSMHHTNLLQNVGAPRVLQSTAAAAIAPVEAKIFAKIVLRNLEHHQNQHVEASI